MVLMLGACTTTQPTSSSLHHQDGSVGSTLAGTPTPSGSSESCVDQYCPRAVWRHLAQRPLRIPRLARNAACPSTRRWTKPHAAWWIHEYGPQKVLGEGPIFPLGPWPYPRAFLLISKPQPQSHRYRFAKVLWAWKAALGPVLIRGRQLNGQHRVRFPIDVADGPFQDKFRLADELRIVAAPRHLGRPSETAVRSPGCYAWQVDGNHFREVIVFRAVPG